MDGYTYWDLGTEEDFIRFSDKALAKIFRALIELKGRFHDSSVLKGGHKESRYWTVSMRISLPDRNREGFEHLTGYKLVTPPQFAASLTSPSKESNIYRSSSLVVTDGDAPLFSEFQ